MNSPNSQATGHQDTEAKINEILKQMTLDEQVLLLSGEDFWSVASLPHLGVGKLRVTDGPNGARGSGSASQGLTSAAFPVGIAVGASWSVDLAELIACAIAEETKSKGAQVCLAPTVNVHRSVTNGRNFECFSEDPVLSSALTTAYIRGMQSQGVAATVKHFAGNESEFERTTMNSEIDERSLREVYLLPFEAAVKEAETWAVMSSYNKLNGTYAAENEWLLSTVLRDEWGFDGIVMSDWFGSRSTAPTVNAGLDLEMPGPTRDRGEKLNAAVDAGEVSPDTVRERARSMLRLMSRVGVLDEMPVFEEKSCDQPEHRALIRKAGSDCAVLLKNEGVLPLAAPNGKIAVIGPNAKVAQIMGGGSSQLNPHYQISPWEGLVNRIGEEFLSFAPGCQNHRWEPIINGQMDVEFHASEDLDGPIVATTKLQASVDFFHPPRVEGKIAANSFSARVRTKYTAEETGLHSFGLHSAGKARLLVNGAKVIEIWDDWKKGRTFFEEGCDEVTGLIDLVAGETYDVVMEFQTVPAANLVNPAFRFGVSRPLGDKAIAEAVKLAAECETTLLFVGRSGEWDTEGSDLDHIKLPGRQDELIRAVAKANPNAVVVLQTGGPVEMPWLEDVPALLQAWYPGQEVGNSIADVLFGDVEPSGRLPQTFPQKCADNPTHSVDPEVYPGKNGNVRYEEGVFIGYRHYDANNITPMFPFGHGLGYTQFDMGELWLSEDAEGVSARIAVKNIGDRAGTAVVQLYVSDDISSVLRPEKELKTFRKLTLEAGDEAEITLSLGPRDFAFFDTKASLWRIEKGTFTLSAGFSAADLRATAQISREAAEIRK